MATHTINDVKLFQNIQLRTITMNFQTQSYVLEHFKEDSKWNFKEKLSSYKDNNGNPVVVGYELTAEIFPIITNIIKGFHTAKFFETVKNEVLNDIVIISKPLANAVNPGYLKLDTKAADYSNLHISHSISSGIGQELEIKISGFLSLDALTNATTKLFTDTE